MPSAAPLPIHRDPKSLRAVIAKWRANGEAVGFAPTMGALHEGHLALVRRLKARCPRVIASVFINPRQFASHEDLSRYPRDEAGDAAKLASAGCDVLYAPDGAAMYPDGFSTTITVAGVSAELEGAHRPQMFSGVATVVAKLLAQVGPDLAAFGEKDYQQLLVVRRLVRDLDMPVDILAGPTVRDADGLALSSRNAYLSPAERAAAPALFAALQACARTLEAGGEPTAAIAKATAALKAAGFGPIDYLALRDADTLAAVTHLDRPARLLAAAWLGPTRLIDNVPVSPAATSHR
jgi:pantoate--beta-alanine ligase